MVCVGGCYGGGGVGGFGVGLCVGEGRGCGGSVWRGEAGGEGGGGGLRNIGLWFLGGRAERGGGVWKSPGSNHGKGEKEEKMTSECFFAGEKRGILKEVKKPVAGGK